MPDDGVARVDRAPGLRTGAGPAGLANGSVPMRTPGHLPDARLGPDQPAVASALSSCEELVTAHYGRILRLCRLLLRDPQEAEEVTQEVFMALHERHGVQEVANWGAWLTRVAVNGVRDRRRAGWWPRWRWATDDIDALPLPSDGPTPEQVLVGKEVRRRVWRCFRALSTRQRQVFVLRQLEGWSTDEVAAALGMTGGAVKTHLHRAIRHLRAAVDDG